LTLILKGMKPKARRLALSAPRTRRVSPAGLREKRGLFPEERDGGRWRSAGGLETRRTPWWVGVGGVGGGHFLKCSPVWRTQTRARAPLNLFSCVAHTNAGTRTLTSPVWGFPQNRERRHRRRGRCGSREVTQVTRRPPVEAETKMFLQRMRSPHTRQQEMQIILMSSTYLLLLLLLLWSSQAAASEYLEKCLIIKTRNQEVKSHFIIRISHYRVSPRFSTSVLLPVLLLVLL